MEADVLPVTTRRRLRLFLPLPVLAVSALVWPLSGADAPSRSAGEVAYHALPEQPHGDAGRGRAGVEESAKALAAWLRALPLHESTEEQCPTHRLDVGWSAPTWQPGIGAFVSPLGPVPTEKTDAVNGFVRCEGAEWAIMGFQARWNGTRWDLVHTPALDASHDHLEEVTSPEPEAPAHVPLAAPVVTVDGRTFGPAIEGLAAYEPQRTCDPTAKPGMAALRNLLLRDNPGSRNLGIIRGCSIGGQSEHKEGRAFDWGVNVSNARERAQADGFVAKLLATDQHGNRYALARRMGIMYMIWNRKIWTAYRADAGWRPYTGASAHTDHVHISMSWAGANGRTSFWSGNVVQVLLASAPAGGSGSAGGGSRPAPAPARRTISTQQPVRDEAGRVRRQAERTADTAPPAQQEAEQKAARDRERAEERAKWQGDRSGRNARRSSSTTTTTVTPTTTTTVKPTTTTTVKPTRTAKPTTTTTVKPTTTTTAKPVTTTTAKPVTTTTAPPPPPPATAKPPKPGRRAPTTTTTAAPVTTTTAKPVTTTTAAGTAPEPEG